MSEKIGIKIKDEIVNVENIFSYKTVRTIYKTYDIVINNNNENVELVISFTEEEKINYEESIKKLNDIFGI